MFLNGLKAKSIIRKLTAENINHSPLTTTNKLRSIGIIEEASNKFDRLKIKMLSKTAGIKEEEVHFMTFVPKKKKEEKENATLFSAKDIGWKGVLKTPHLKEFRDRNFDLLISYYATDALALNVVSSLTKSKFKVAIQSDLYDTHDLVLAIEVNQTDLFIKELNKYLEILKIK